jgi:predicted N-acetyltransferase YhbS
MTDVMIKLLPSEEAADIVARWQYTEWRAGYEGMTFATLRKEISDGIRANTIPLVLVAEIDGKILGTASIVKNDLPTRVDLNPWLASIYVKEGERGRGIASRLITAALTHAKEIGVERIFLFTHDLSDMYAKFGFEEYDYATFMGERVTIMICDIRTAKATRLMKWPT